MPVIDIRDASFAYGERVAARGVTLAVEPGEVVALLGPNGSGKTTVVRGMLGLAQTVAGQVNLFGTPADQFHERWRIGYVPQRHTIAGAIPSTVAEVVSSGRLPRKRLWSLTTAADRAAVASAIEEVGLSDRTHSPVGTLSGGQQRRVLIARALAAQPEVLVMDEPTAGVDAANAARLVATLEQLVRGGLTLLIVTHELTALRSVLTRAVLMRDGAVIADSPAAQADWTEAHDIGHDHHHDSVGLGGRPSDPVREPAPSWLRDALGEHRGEAGVSN